MTSPLLVAPSTALGREENIAHSAALGHVGQQPANATTAKRATKKAPGTPIKRIHVNLAKRGYDILVSYNWLDMLGQQLQICGLSTGNVMVFTSPKIGNLYYAKLKESLEAGGFRNIVRHNIPDGERNKNFFHYGKCLDALGKNFPDPGSVPLVINLGGGVVGDIGGFAAGTFNRGVNYAQVPTTLLGCVDCGVGGKLGINGKYVKNQIGIFYQPKLVFADLALLKTLSLREIRSGTAEVIKYGAVCDEGLFEYLEKNIEKLLALEPTVLTKIVSDCFGIKTRIVEQDEQDTKGIRAVLNFGHTIGHALEMAANYRMTHGEAISVGMIAATRIAVELKTCKIEVYERLRALIERAGLPTSAHDKRISFERVMSNMAKDKKFLGGKNCFVLPAGIGKSLVQKDINQKLIIQTVRRCLAR